MEANHTNMARKKRGRTSETSPFKSFKRGLRDSIDVIKDVGTKEVGTKADVTLVVFSMLLKLEKSNMCHGLQLDHNV